MVISVAFRGCAATTGSGAEVDKPTPGSPLCTCQFLDSIIQRTVSSGLRIIRTRFKIEISELPDLKPEDLDCYLLNLLGSPAARPFPMWRSRRTHSLHRLGRLDRWTLAHSCASIKRSLDFAPCKVHPPESNFRSFFDSATTPNPPASTKEYLEFARKTTRKLFPFGWDRTLYSSFVSNHVPQATSRYDGSKSDKYWSRNSNKKEFEAACMTGRLPSHIKGNFKLRLSEVPTAGKVRRLGIPNHEFELLGPLHKTIYQHLTKQKWLLRGPPKSKRIEKVCTYDWQTSVDLVSASDGLCLDVTEVVLGSLLSKAETIPGKIRELAHQSLYAELEVKENNKKMRAGITHGQMMGTYLSFPLLCLQSYIAAQWACRGIKSEVIVNGDDTLISSDDQKVLDRYPPNLKINRKKTMVKRTVAEINSTAFLKEGSRWREAKQMRRGGYTGSVDSLIHTAGACVKAGPKWVTAFVKSRVGKKKCLRAEDLRLPMTNYAVYLRNRHLESSGKYKRVCEEESQSMDERLEKVRESPDSDAVYAVKALIFDQGRAPSTLKKNRKETKTATRPIEKSPLLLQMMKRKGFNNLLSYSKDIVGKRKERVYFIVDGYESINEARARETKEKECRWEDAEGNLV